MCYFITPSVIATLVKNAFSLISSKFPVNAREHTRIKNRKEHIDLPSFSQTLYSNYPIIYYLSQMLKQPKPTDVIILQNRELLLQILHTHRHT